MKYFCIKADTRTHTLREKCPNTKFFPECGKTRTRKNFIFGHFSCSDKALSIKKYFENICKSGVYFVSVSLKDNKFSPFPENMDEISLLEYFIMICRNNISTYIEHKGLENQLMPAVKKWKTFFGIQIQTLDVVKQYGSK